MSTLEMLGTISTTSKMHQNAIKCHYMFGQILDVFTVLYLFICLYVPRYLYHHRLRPVISVISLILFPHFLFPSSPISGMPRLQQPDQRERQIFGPCRVGPECLCRIGGEDAAWCHQRLGDVFSTPAEVDTSPPKVCQLDLGSRSTRMKKLVIF